MSWFSQLSFSKFLCDYGVMSLVYVLGGQTCDSLSQGVRCSAKKLGFFSNNSRSPHLKMWCTQCLVGDFICLPQDMLGGTRKRHRSHKQGLIFGVCALFSKSKWYYYFRKLLLRKNIGDAVNWLSHGTMSQDVLWRGNRFWRCG